MQESPSLTTQQHFLHWILTEYRTISFQLQNGLIMQTQALVIKNYHNVVKHMNQHQI